MPTTSEDRDKHELCGAKGRSGSPCRAYAGQGTDHPGIGRCRHHGGSTTSHKKHAVAVEAKRQMVKMGQPIKDMHPAQALLGLLRSTAGHVAWLNEEIQALDELSSPEGETLVRLYDSERDRLTRVGVACVQAGATEHEIRMVESETTYLIDMFSRAAELAGLPPEYQRAMGTAFRFEAAKAGQESGATLEEAEARFADARAKAQAAFDKLVLAEAAKRPPEELAYPPEEWTPDAEVVDADGV